MFVCSLFCLAAWNSSAPTRRIFMEFRIWVLFEKCVKKIQVWSKSAKNEYFIWRPIYFYDSISPNSSSNEKYFRQTLVSKRTLSSTLRTRTHTIRTRRFHSYWFLLEEECSSFRNVACVYCVYVFLRCWKVSFYLLVRCYIKHALIFFLQRLSGTFLILRKNSAWWYYRRTVCHNGTSPLFLSDFNEAKIFWTFFFVFETYSCEISWKSVQWKLSFFPCGRTDGQTGQT